MQRCAARAGRPIFSSALGKWVYDRDYEPSRMFQIASCAECGGQNDGRECHDAHLRIRDSQTAIFEDIGAPALANDVYNDAQEIADRFLGRI